MQFMFDKCIPIEITPLVKTSKSIMATESVVLIVFCYTGCTLVHSTGKSTYIMTKGQ